MASVSDWFGQPWEEAVLSGTKPVLRVEGRRSEDDSLPRYPGAAIFRRPRKEDGAGDDIFVGLDPKRVKLAALLTERQHQRLNRQDWAETTVRLGTALGYPACCVRAYVQDGPNRDGWLVLRRRLETPGPVDPVFNPGPMCYVPCALDCAATLGLARSVQQASAPGAHSLGLRSCPTIFFCAEEEFAFLMPEGELPVQRDGTLRFRYRSAAGRLGVERRRALAEGEELSVEPGFVRVFAAGRQTSVFPEAFLWWHRAALHVGFWWEQLRSRQVRLHP